MFEVNNKDKMISAKNVVITNPIHVTRGYNKYFFKEV